MERIFAPWRMAYLKGELPEPREGCIFCWKPAEDQDERNLIIERHEHCFVIMNLYPYTNSHLMVVPYRHTADLGELEDAELLGCQQAIRRVVQVLQQFIRPQGFNIGMNIGRAGGAGIESHLHWHVVPRWLGDTNFMSVTGDTKVISESIPEGWQRLREAFGAMPSPSSGT